MKRALPNAPSLKRPIKRVTPKVEIVIICEGKNTEPDYFSACVNYYGAGLVRLRTIAAAGVPDTLVNAAILERDLLLAKKRASPDSFDACFRVWAVFDRDAHPLVDQSIEKAISNKIDIAFSSPCFEIWPILHLQDYGAQDGRHELQRLLSSIMPGYDHSKGAVINFELIKDGFDIAYKRSEILTSARRSEGCAYQSPCTTVGALVRKIIQNGKWKRASTC